MDHGPDGILADPPDQLRAYIRDGRIELPPWGFAWLSGT